MTYCYLNGQTLPVKDAVVGLTDIGLLRGFGVFDVLIAYDGKPFYLAEHLARFQRSAASVGLVVPESDEAIAQHIDTLLAKSQLSQANIRLLLTGGKAQGLGFDPEQPTFAIIIEEYHPYSKGLYEAGGTLITERFQRPLADIKHLDYIAAVKLQKKVKAADAVEVLFTTETEVLEAATSNFFIVKDDRLITPKEDILVGITRNIVLDIAKDHLLIEERPISLDELWLADEAFITATNKEIIPIVKIDDKMIGSGQVGQKTRVLMEQFQLRKNQ